MTFSPSAPPAPAPLWAGRTLALLGIVLVAVNLRSAVTALSPLVSIISGEIPLDSVQVGILGMLPPVCFAVFGLAAPAAARRLGVERLVVLACVMMLLGHLVRAGAGSFAVLAIGGALCFAGMGIGNVLLPPLVKKYFPDRIGLVTSIYVTALSVGTFVPPILAVPVAEAAGWRTSLGAWSILVVLAVTPWIILLVRNHRARAKGQAPRIDTTRQSAVLPVWRSPMAWAVMVVFAVSSLNFYAMSAWLPLLLIDQAGVDAGTAGLMVGIYAAAGIPAALVVPVLASRMKNVNLLVTLGVAAFVVGDLGLILAPGAATWLWVLLAGIGPLLFPLALTLINLRTRTPEGAAAVSGFVQGIGYVIGASGPLFFGIIHQATGNWQAPMVFLLALALCAQGAGWVVSKRRTVEEELSARTS